MKKKLTILGSTGSIGRSTLRAYETLIDEYVLYGITCKSNIEYLAEQVEQYTPQVVAIQSETVASSDRITQLKKKFPNIEFLTGEEGVVECASREVDVSVSAIVGAAGLRPTLASIGNAKRIALANKETLVMAGSLFMEEIERTGTELIPVDSEHSAIFSLKGNVAFEDIDSILLTASGGSLRDIPVEELQSITPDRALKHPTWSMGNKITIDSATLMNKGLEVIEAHYLFNFNYNDIKVIIHPESIVHSMIETVDGALYAHLGVADMAFPILNALTYPKKIKNKFGRLDLTSVGSLSFQKWDTNRYPALELCYEAGRTKGTMPAILNAANEVAVHAFLREEISFTSIVSVVDRALKSIPSISAPVLDDIFEADKEARRFSEECIKEI